MVGLLQEAPTARTSAYHDTARGRLELGCFCGTIGRVWGRTVTSVNPKPPSERIICSHPEPATVLQHEEVSAMNTLPTKKPGDPDVNTIPTWRELAERFRNLMKDF